MSEQIDKNALKYSPAGMALQEILDTEPADPESPTTILIDEKTLWPILVEWCNTRAEVQNDE